MALTIADNSYMGLDSISFIDFRKPWQHTKSPMRLFPMGHTHMPETSETGYTETMCKNHFLSFRKEKDRRFLKFHMDHFYDHKTLDGEITLEDHSGDSMVIAMPFCGRPPGLLRNQKSTTWPRKVMSIWAISRTFSARKNLSVFWIGAAGYGLTRTLGTGEAALVCWMECPLDLTSDARVWAMIPRPQKMLLMGIKPTSCPV